LIADTATYQQGSDTLDSLNDEIVINTKGYSTVANYVAGTFVGTIKAYASVDGTNYFAVTIINRITASVVTEITTTGPYIVNCSGYMFIKFIMNPYTSGAADMTWAMAMGGGVIESFGASGVVNTVVIRDRNNPAYEAEVDSQNRLKVSVTATNTFAMELQWAEQVGPPVKDIWQEVVLYTVPAGYKIEAVRFNASAANSTSWARACIENVLATFDLDTDVFTDGVVVAFPGFAPELAIEITADIVANSTITITYINQDNVAGRVATFDVVGVGPNKMYAGYIFKIPLQSGDLGIRDITNVTSGTATVGGDFILTGYSQLFIENMTIANQLYTQFAPREALIIQPNEKIALHYRSSQTSAVDRVIQISGTLVPTT